MSFAVPTYRGPRQPPSSSSAPGHNINNTGTDYASDFGLYDESYSHNNDKNNTKSDNTRNQNQYGQPQFQQSGYDYQNQHQQQFHQQQEQHQHQLQPQKQPLSHRFVRGLLLVVMTAALCLFGLLVAWGPVDGAGDPTPGMWAKTASVNWCEPDYAYTPWIAELGNSLSSLVIVAYGLWGILAHRGRGLAGQVGLESRFPLAYAMFCVVGVGSFLFHATLLRSMQLLDELPMIWANSVFIYIIVQMEQPCALDQHRRGDIVSAQEQSRQTRRRRFLVAGLIVATVVMSACVTWFDSEDQNIFLVCYVSGLTFIVLRSLQLNHRYNVPGLGADPKVRSLLRSVVLVELSNVAYFLGLIAWLVDRLFCPSVAGLHLHSLWHFCAGIGTFLAVLFWLWTRLVVRGHPAVVRGALPIVWRVDVLQKVV